MAELIEGFLGKSVDGKKSRMPARLDLVQSGTGLFLALFMWVHMAFVSTVLISPSFFNSVVDVLEGSWFMNPNALVTSFAVAVVFVVFFTHALLAMRKFPINFRQWQQYRTHMMLFKHKDTTLWFVQAITGFILFFFGSFHLGFIGFMSDQITAEFAGYRMVDNYMWIFYLILLVVVELHGSIGLYRLCVKWGWFEGKDAAETRKKLTKVKWAITGFLFTLGILSMLAFVKIGFGLNGAMPAPKTHTSEIVVNEIILSGVEK